MVERWQIPHCWRWSALPPSRPLLSPGTERRGPGLLHGDVPCPSHECPRGHRADLGPRLQDTAMGGRGGEETEQPRYRAAEITSAIVPGARKAGEAGEGGHSGWDSCWQPAVRGSGQEEDEDEDAAPHAPRSHQLSHQRLPKKSRSHRRTRRDATSPVTAWDRRPGGDIPLTL